MAVKTLCTEIWDGTVAKQSLRVYAAARPALKREFRLNPVDHAILARATG